MPCAFFFEQISDFMQDFEELSKARYKEEEITAGVESLQGWGVYATASSMAEGCPLKLKRLLAELTAREAYTAMLYRKDVNEYQERLSEVYRIKNKVK